MSAVDLTAFRDVPLTRDPFDFLIVPDFLKAEAMAGLDADFPPIDRPGSFPVSALEYGPAFASLLDELRGPEVAKAFRDKFEVDLDGRPTMITVRGRCQAKDGRVHTDTETKIITALIYLNGDWTHDGGRLRLLRSSDDIEDYVAEVPPQAGTLLAFRRSDKSYHGHKPFVGERRSIQLNWVTEDSVVRREEARHRVSARLKKLFAFG